MYFIPILWAIFRFFYFYIYFVFHFIFVCILLCRDFCLDFGKQQCNRKSSKRTRNVFTHLKNFYAIIEANRWIFSHIHLKRPIEYQLPNKFPLLSIVQQPIQMKSTLSAKRSVQSKIATEPNTMNHFKRDSEYKRNTFEGS